MVTKSESALDNSELLTEATKFDNSNVPNSKFMMLNWRSIRRFRKKRWNFFMFKLWIWSQLHRSAKRIDASPEDKKTKRRCWCPYRVCKWNWPWKKTIFRWRKLQLSHPAQRSKQFPKIWMKWRSKSNLVQKVSIRKTICTQGACTTDRVAPEQLSIPLNKLPCLH